jgi:glycosyltransferase involved in cell wall biosynthesis
MLLPFEATENRTLRPARRTRLKILLSAYACLPHRGSEPGIGWNTAVGLAARHEVWVLTDGSNRAQIERECAQTNIRNIRFIYHDLPFLPQSRLYSLIWEQLHYYFWQLTARFLVARLHDEVRFDVAHHITFAKYYAPTCLDGLSIPFVLGPLGGGESAPLSFWPTFGFAGIAYELARSCVRWIGENDPFVRRGIVRCAYALGSTRQTTPRLKKLGARRVGVMCREAFVDSLESNSDVSDTASELARLLSSPVPGGARLRFVSIGRLLHWKGFHLSLEAFARADIPGAEYWIIGGGPERARLERIAQRLQIGTRVCFWGEQPRENTLKLLIDCHVFVFPSLHDSGSGVCVEAMAAGRPVICFDIGGPGLIVTRKQGIKCGVSSPSIGIAEMATAMRDLASDPQRREELGRGGRSRIKKHFVASKRAMFYSRCLMSASKGQAL